MPHLEYAYFLAENHNSDQLTKNRILKVILILYDR